MDDKLANLLKALYPLEAWDTHKRAAVIIEHELMKALQELNKE